MLNISAAGWDTDSGTSRVPIHITGKTVDGITVDKVEFAASDGSGISLIQGVYALEAAGSPIATDGKIYQIPCTSATLVLDDVFAAGETINLAELAEQDSILTFCPIDASDMTNDEIYDAALLAMAYKGDDAPMLPHCARQQSIVVPPPAKARTPSKVAVKYGLIEPLSWQNSPNFTATETGALSKRAPLPGFHSTGETVL